MFIIVYRIFISMVKYGLPVNIHYKCIGGCDDDKTENIVFVEMQIFSRVYVNLRLPIGN
jgi:hypothetical protein